MIYPHLDLRLMCIVAGLWLIFSHGFALLRPAQTRKWMLKFPRSKIAGTVLLMIDSVWALVMIGTMDLGEFSHLRMPLLGVIVAATFLTFRFVDEFLAVRALGMLLLLLAEPLVEAAFLQPQRGKFLLVLLAYAWAVIGMFWVGVPYLLRDQVETLVNSRRAWTGAFVTGLIYGGLLAAVGAAGI